MFSERLFFNYQNANLSYFSIKCAETDKTRHQRANKKRFRKKKSSVHKDLFLLAVENKFQYFIEMKEINNTVIKIVHKYLDCTLFLLQDQKICLNKGQ